eukprot:Skav223624  [mRNA]  locus=scaffold3504:57298:61176:- [translate_table: standard]
MQAVLCILISFLLATSATALWPKPRLVKTGTTRTVLNPNRYSFKATPSTAELENAFKRYAAIFFPHATLPVPDPSESGVVIHVSDPSAALALDADESYTLDVSVDGSSVISAKTVWGALHGLETLSQMVEFNFTTGARCNELNGTRDSDRQKRVMLVDSHG